MGRRGQHTPRVIAGDPADVSGWPRLVEEFCEWMGAHGYSPRTIATAGVSCRRWSTGWPNAASPDPSR